MARYSVFKEPSLSFKEMKKPPRVSHLEAAATVSPACYYLLTDKRNADYIAPFVSFSNVAKCTK